MRDENWGDLSQIKRNQSFEYVYQTGYCEDSQNPDENDKLQKAKYNKMMGELSSLQAQIEEDEHQLKKRIIKHELKKMQTKKELAVIENDLKEIR